MKVTLSNTLSKSFEINKEDSQTLIQAFKEQHYNIPALLGILKEYLEYDLNHLDRKRKVSTKSLVNQLASCRGWTLDEQEIIEE